MDTLDFLKATLPDTGVYYLVLFRKGHPAPGHVPYTSLESMAADVEKYAKSPGLQVYHACASYQHPHVMVGDKKKYRIPENQSLAKAFWADIDCGQTKFDEGKGYLLRSDAVKALYDFADELAIPRPMIVSSGFGVHAYWPLDRAIRAEKWQPVADALKACLAHYGVIVDPSRTADFASILRPPGSANRKAEWKGEDTAKAVVVKTECEPAHPATIAKALASYRNQHNVQVLATKPPAPVDNGLNSDMTGLLQQAYPEQNTSGELIAQNGCLQMQVLRDTRGDVSYDVWRLGIGVLRHCVDGEQLAEEWTSNREATGHDQTDWRMRYETWTTPPSTCAAFEGAYPSGCMGCVHRGKIKTPMEIGRVVPEVTQLVVEQQNPEDDPVELPQGYEWQPGYRGGRMIYHKRNADGTVDIQPFSSHLIWPVRYVKDDGVYAVQVHAQMPGGHINVFNIPYEATATAGELAKALAKRGAVSVTTGDNAKAGANMVGYMQAQLQRLQSKQREHNTHKSFGWQDVDCTSFLIGERLYLPDGTTRRVMTGGNADATKRLLPEPRGTLQGYAAAIDRIYNRPGLEWAQLTICGGYGSILSPLAGEELYKGVLFALQGGTSGKGKTTACQASLFAFGDAAEMTLGGKSGFTINGLWGTVATLNNIPMLADELTNIDPKDLSDMAYGIANGKEKVRMHAGNTGVQLADRATWSMSPFVTGNADFLSLLANNQANSQAEAMRLIQLNVDSYPDVPLHENPGMATAIIRQAVRDMRDNMGCAGDMLVRYVVQNVQAVRAELEKQVDALAHDLPGTKYRFYRCHLACALVAGRIANEMGVVAFDMDALREFAVAAMIEQVESVAETNSLTPETAFGRFASELLPRTLGSRTLYDARQKGACENVKLPPRGEIWARSVVDTKHLYVELSRLREWCSKNRMDYRAVLASLEAEKALVSRRTKMSLTRGTDASPLPSTDCFIVDINKLDKVLSLVPLNGVDPAEEAAA